MVKTCCPSTISHDFSSMISTNIQVILWIAEPRKNPLTFDEILLVFLQLGAVHILPEGLWQTSPPGKQGMHLKELQLAETAWATGPAAWSRAGVPPGPASTAMVTMRALLLSWLGTLLRPLFCSKPLYVSILIPTYITGWFFIPYISPKQPRGPFFIAQLIAEPLFQPPGFLLLSSQVSLKASIRVSDAAWVRVAFFNDLELNF